MKSKKFKENQQRCIYSNKIINGREVLIKDYAKDYVLKTEFIELIKKK